MCGHGILPSHVFSSYNIADTPVNNKDLGKSQVVHLYCHLFGATLAVCRFHLPVDMPDVKRLVFDMLKPHQPDSPELGKCLAVLGGDDKITLPVQKMDEEITVLQLQFEGESVATAGLPCCWSNCSR